MVAGGLHRGERVALVATGALTNVALLLILYPEVTAMVEITLMGGAMGMGNTGPVQEFNIQAKIPNTTSKRHINFPVPAAGEDCDACPLGELPTTMSVQ